MSVLTKLAFPLWLSAICAMATVPAHAQFQGAEAQMGQFAPIVEQFAPMIEQMAPWIQKMQNRIGKKRMARLGLSMQKVKAIFISHEHTDHIKGLGVLARKYRLPVYVTDGTVHHCGDVPKELCIPLKSYLPVKNQRLDN